MSRFWVWAVSFFRGVCLLLGLRLRLRHLFLPQYDAVRGLFPKEESVDLDSLAWSPRGCGKPARAARGGGRGLYFYASKRRSVSSMVNITRVAGLLGKRCDAAPQ